MADLLFNCLECGRELKHKGKCLACNMKAKKEREEQDINPHNSNKGIIKGIFDKFKKKPKKELTKEDAKNILKEFDEENKELIEKIDLLEEERKNTGSESLKIKYLAKELGIAQELYSRCDNDYKEASEFSGYSHFPASLLALKLSDYAIKLLISGEYEKQINYMVKESENLFETHKIGIFYRPFILSNLKTFYELFGKIDEVAEILPKLKRAEELFKSMYGGDEEPDDEDIENFEGKVKSIKKIRTQNGHYVCSNGEKIIADFLHNNGIDYDYDRQITLRGNEKNRNGYDTSWCRPDFYLTEFDLIIEYWGLKGEQDYDAKMEDKKRLYKEAGKKFISISKEDLPNIENILKMKMERIGVRI